MTLRTTLITPCTRLALAAFAVLGMGQAMAQQDVDQAARALAQRFKPGTYTVTRTVSGPTGQLSETTQTVTHTNQSIEALIRDSVIGTAKSCRNGQAVLSDSLFEFAADCERSAEVAEPHHYSGLVHWGSSGCTYRIFKSRTSNPPTAKLLAGEELLMVRDGAGCQVKPVRYEDRPASGD